ncbi:MAG: zinc ribbon domain-containing protein [Eubacterium sp.]|nr:zinc ribbon domain-containing protein [Eubacterium sp.]
MNCNNCGAKVRDNEKICPNCGALIDESEGFVSLASSEFEDVYSDGKPPKKKKSGVKWFLSILLTLAIIGGGAYYYFEYVYEKQDEKPAVTFECGSGIINGDEKIIYADIKDGSSIEYIHGVKLYDYDVTQTKNGAPAVSTQYQYTKSINDSFRAIFFDTADLKLDDENTYTFEMQFSFSGSSDTYTYTAVVNFTKDITADVSDIIFDHSVEGESTTADDAEETTKAEKTTKKEEETTTEKAADDLDFVYESYWYTRPVKDGDDYTIYAFKFKEDGKYTSTRYYKNGKEDWDVTTENGTYQMSDSSIIVNGKNDTTEFFIDVEGKLLTYDDGGKLSARKYNSEANAEDFFGI